MSDPYGSAIVGRQSASTSEKSPYVIEVDRAHDIVEVRMAGFWSTGDVAAYATEIEGIVRDLTAATGRKPRLLIDAINTVVQSLEVTEAMRVLSERLAPRLGRTAMLAGGQLLRMQVRRVVTGLTTTETFASFDNRQAAIAWLTIT